MTTQEALERLEIWWERLKNPDLPLLCEPDRKALAVLKSAVGERDAFRAAANAYLDIIGERHKERDALRAEVEELRTRLEENEVCVVEGVGIPSV